MTDEEYTRFADRLFVQYPSLWEWLGRNSPDPLATQSLWRDTLRPYSFAECLGVLSDWQSGGRTPFEAYQRDQVAVIIRSVVEQERSKRAKKQESEAWVKAKRDARRRRGDAVGFDVTDSMDSEMQMVYLAMRPIHKRMLDGEMTEADYRAKFDQTCKELLK